MFAAVFACYHPTASGPHLVAMSSCAEEYLHCACAEHPLSTNPGNATGIYIYTSILYFAWADPKAPTVLYSSYSTKDQRPVLYSYQIGAVLLSQLHFSTSSTKTASQLDAKTLDGTKTCSSGSARESIRTGRPRPPHCISLKLPLSNLLNWSNRIIIAV